MKKLIKTVRNEVTIYIRTQQQQNNIPLEYFCSLDKPKVGGANNQQQVRI